jgi:hypothetical protein
MPDSLIVIFALALVALVALGRRASLEVNPTDLRLGIDDQDRPTAGKEAAKPKRAPSRPKRRGKKR